MNHRGELIAGAEALVRAAHDLKGLHERTPLPESPELHGRGVRLLGTSVENQQAADERIPHLLRCPAAVRFLSCEPLLGTVDLTAIGEHDGRPVSCLTDHPCVDDEPGGNGIDWVIVGGEKVGGTKVKG